jgi:serine/threonine protein kinase
MRWSTNVQALGVLTYEFLCGEEPFAADTSADPRCQWPLKLETSRPCSWPVKQQRICRVDVRYPEHVSLEARDFMNKVRWSRAQCN